MKLTGKAEKIAPFYVMELLEKAKALEANGENIVHMEVGEPDFATPQALKEKAIEAIKGDRTFYTHSLGIPELRSRIAEYYEATQQVHISPERIVITAGASGAFQLLSAILLDRDKPLGISDPGYPCYKAFGLLSGARIIPIPVTEDSGFQVTVGHLSRLKRLPYVLIVSTPSNPTGIVYDEETVDELYRFMARKGRVLVADELYNGLIYGEKARTALSLSDDMVVINGFSKTHAMTGWRLGWMVVPPALVRPIQKVAQNIFISPPSIAQYAALHAFDITEELERMRKTYEQRRDFMLPRLKNMGFRIPVEPQGAFYIYADISKWSMDSMEFVERALSEAKIALTPGYDFGLFKAGSYIRFSYANNLVMLEEGCRRLEAWLPTL